MKVFDVCSVISCSVGWVTGRSWLPTMSHLPQALSVSIHVDEDKLNQSDTYNSPRISSEKKRKITGEKILYLGLMIIPSTRSDVYFVYLVYLVSTHYGLLIAIRLSVILSSVIWFPVSLGLQRHLAPQYPLIPRVIWCNPRSLAVCPFTPLDGWNFCSCDVFFLAFK